MFGKQALEYTKSSGPPVCVCVRVCVCVYACAKVHAKCHIPEREREKEREQGSIGLWLHRLAALVNVCPA